MNKFDAEIVTKDLINWIKRYFVTNGDEDTKAVIGISGGKDSTIAAALCVRALGPEKVFGVLMPCGDQADIEDAYKVCEYLGIPNVEVNIGCTMDALTEAIPAKFFGERNNIHYTNAPARLRMTALYSIAGLIGGRVVCTSNRSEIYIGYSTKWGDGVGDLKPFEDLTVTELYAIGEYLEIPKDLLYKAPADGMTGKTDEEILGFTYKELDHYILTNELPGDVESYRKINRRHRAALHKTGHVPSFYKRIFREETF